MSHAKLFAILQIILLLFFSNVNKKSQIRPCVFADFYVVFIILKQMGTFSSFAERLSPKKGLKGVHS